MPLMMVYALKNYSTMLIDDFNDTINIWIDGLVQYNFTQLCTKPTLHSWSVGQLYVHLITDTMYHCEQIRICVSGNHKALEVASPAAQTMFLNNAFPHEMIQGTPESLFILQPDDKHALMNQLLALKVEVNQVAALIAQSRAAGKTKHPGLGYFNANEWLQFGEMHFRHHLRQKERIDHFLNIPKRY